jgi:Family of unknown function (DUF5755)
MKKCPPGVICIENVTMTLFVIVLLVVVYLVYKQLNSSNSKYRTSPENVIINEQPRPGPRLGPGIGAPGFVSLPSFPYNNLPEDVLLNPYSPPLKDDRYFIPEMPYAPPFSIPINVSSNIGAVDTNYRQLGILTPLNGANKDNILPLMGRPLFTNRQKFQYYTISNQHNNIKLPVSVKGRSGTNEYGVDELFTGDTVYIEGYNDAFRVTVYDNDTIKYLPFL